MVDCGGRKPKPGLILRAAKDYNIRLKDSWMIGDGGNDIKAGIAAGCHTVLLDQKVKDVVENSIDDWDFTAGMLLAAVDHIL